jgi:hypothetical protein
MVRGDLQVTIQHETSLAQSKFSRGARLTPEETEMLSGEVWRSYIFERLEL